MRKISSFQSSDADFRSKLTILERLEIDREQVSIVRELGEGQFGKV
jgi:hypothetical protein